MPNHRNPLRFVTVIAAVVALGSVSVAPEAHAGGKRKSAKVATLDVKKIGVPAIDEFFADVRRLDNRLDKAQKARRTGRRQLNKALGLDLGTPLPTAMRHFKKRSNGKIRLAYTNGIPQLRALGALSGDLNASIKAMNTALRDYDDAIRQLAGMPGEVAKLLRHAQNIRPLLAEAGVSGLDANTLFVGLKILFNGGEVRDNFRILKSLPSRTKNVTKNLSRDIQLVTKTFRTGAF